jgi:serine/threonine-protein kinase
MEPSTQTPPPAASAVDLTGETFGDFRIQRLLGKGGMGEVYLAEQVSLQRKVAIKVLREDLAANPTMLERFKAESKAVAQLSHTNVVQVHTVGEHDGRHYMVLEYVEGKSLCSYLVRKGPLDVVLVLSIMRQVASALNRASEMGIVHRDIKPENILLTRKAEAKVADFGLARCFALDVPQDLTRTGTTMGTPLYMSPEQIQGKGVDHRSDLYSFGVTCYQMLAGHTPFTGSNAYEIAVKHVRDEPEPLDAVRPDVPAELCAVVHKLMAKDPDERYQSAHELLKEIARVRESHGGTTGAVTMAGVGTEALPTKDDSKPVPVRRRRGPAPWIIALVALGGLGVVSAGFAAVVLVGAGLAWRHHSPPATADAGGDAAPPSPKTDKAGAEWGAQPGREESLKKLVEQHLADVSPKPAGVEDCIALGVLYLDQNKVGDAAALFKRMDDRRPPSAYHYVGRLGLAVTDGLANNSRASHAKFTELFDPKSKDNRAQILNDYLAKNPDFARWVNEADSSNVRNGVTESALPQGLKRPPFGRPGGKRP